METTNIRRTHAALFIGPVLLLGATFSAARSTAQVSQYTFDQVVEPWTALTGFEGGFELGTPATAYSRVYVDPADPAGALSQTYLQPVNGPGLPIGFSFGYNGDQFDRIGISSQGWIGFGKSSDGASAVSVYGADGGAAPLSTSFHNPLPAYKRNRVAGFGAMGLRAQDRTQQEGFASSLRMATIGTAPNRICVVQWQDFRRAFSWNTDRITFQIRLHETTNMVEVRYGSMQWGTTTANPAEVGLGGTSNADYNNRMTVYGEPAFVHDWNTTVAGVAANSSCRAYSPSANQINEPSVYPQVGLSFRWNAPNCPAPASPIDITGITFNSAVAEWLAVPGATGYAYVLSTTANPDTPTPVASGSTAATTVALTGLDALTTYYLYIRSVCGGVPGNWGGATQFTTQGGTLLICGDAPLDQTHCSSQNTTVTWRYSTSDGVSPVRVAFSQGYMGGPNGGAYFRIYDGASDTAPVIFEAGWGDVLPGQVFTSSGPDLFMKLVTDNGSCETQPWFTPWIWTVGCKDCTEAFANYNVVPDCANQQFSVDVLLVGLGSASSITIDNDLGVAPLVVNAAGTYTVGPFTAGQEVVLTLVNPDNALCNVSNVPLVNEPCSILDCGPTDHEHCYGNNEIDQWLYQGDGESVGIRFRSGRVGANDQLRIHDAIDPFSVTPWTQGAGDLANVLRTSTNPEFALFMEMSSNPAGSCEDGLLDPWDYVVGCHGACTQPTATFSVVEDCDNDQFSVLVNVTGLGSTGSVSITNDGGAAAVPASTTGTYTIGPFASLAQVVVEVEGANELCSWTSPVQTFDCSDVGMAETATRQLRTYPNPSDGIFRVVLPQTISGSLLVEVRDLSGRAVYWENAAPSPSGELLLDIGHLPSGLYMAILVAGNDRFLARLDLSN